LLNGIVSATTAIVIVKIPVVVLDASVSKIGERPDRSRAWPVSPIVELPREDNGIYGRNQAGIFRAEGYQSIPRNREILLISSKPTTRQMSW